MILSSKIYLFIFMFIVPIYAKQPPDQLPKPSTTELIKEKEESSLLLSTLDGSLLAVDQFTGNIKWKMKDEPAVKVPIESSKSVAPLFLPDPKDGSLYIFGGTSKQDALKKLPFTIPQLVASSPCRSSDGILYTGKKIDTWFAVDRKTGNKEQILSFDKIAQVCPVEGSVDTVFIGRTEYNIMMYDSVHKQRKWNITFYDYSSTMMDQELINNYELAHFTASSSGRMLTLDRHSSDLVWEHQYPSPVVAVYLLRSGPSGSLVTVPFTSVADETLDHLTKQRTDQQQRYGSLDMQLYPTLYIGEHPYGMYALPSLVDGHTVTISLTGYSFLLDGPNDNSASSSSNIEKQVKFPMPGHNFRVNSETPTLEFQSLPKSDSNDKPPIIILGHYQVPEFSKNLLQITGRSDPIEIRANPGSLVIVDDNNSTQMKSPSEKPVTGNSLFSIIRREEQDSNIKDETISIKNRTSSYISFFDFETYQSGYHFAKQWINHQENKGLKLLLIILVGCIISMFWYLHVQVKEFQELSRQNSRGSSNGFHDSSRMGELSGDQSVDLIKIGHVTFNPKEVLGKGCDGTFVYRGTFDNRDVAVKRLVGDCLEIGGREAELLRESDQHPHVIRCFCTERDRQFSYIALELCAATLADFIEGRYEPGPNITEDTILSQATSGLNHLHSLNIVHRDIKPHNVLLSMPDAHGHVRAMISDFGLCKKLQMGRLSFSRRSGITGTDGWIAPEMLENYTRTTCLVDIFSLGCVFYYVWSGGKHPFGDTLRRQANIISGEFSLNALDAPKYALERHLVEAMISKEPNQRPSAVAVSKHPVFWLSENVLNFYQDISDRVEKDDESSRIMMALENDLWNVCCDDWRTQIDTELAEDLRRYRSYRGESIRDLLRALRNKKHHYRELSPAAQNVLGSIPQDFVAYWTSRFPYLLLHSWLAFQVCYSEPIFQRYYDADYSWSPPRIPSIEKQKPLISFRNNSPDRRKWHSRNTSTDPVGSDGDSPKLNLLWRQRRDDGTRRRGPKRPPPPKNLNTSQQNVKQKESVPEWTLPESNQ